MSIKLKNLLTNIQISIDIIKLIKKNSITILPSPLPKSTNFPLRPLITCKTF